jgi:N-methylhydantoinase B
MGACPDLYGLSAMAFPSGVHTMPTEAPEHAGPIVIWRKELCPGSGADGEFRSGLGQVLEIAPRWSRILRDVRPHPTRTKTPQRRK